MSNDVRTNIYTMMTFEKCEKSSAGFVDMGNTRVVGFMHDLEDAIHLVTWNYGDIWETCYTYAVIEEVRPGLYPNSRKRWMFKYNHDIDRYEPIEVPEMFNNMISLTMG